MEPEEKLLSAPQLKEEGNRLFKENKMVEASLKYSEAIGRLEQLLLREKPGEKEWEELMEMKIPLLLNYSQCQLGLGNYHPVIEHCTEVLQYRPDCVKAVYRRAKAHVEVWNPEEAREDFEHVAALDPSMAAVCHKEIKAIEELKRIKNEEDKKMLTNLFS